MKYEPVSFYDVTGSYVYVLLGFFAQLYLLSSTAIYFTLEEELQEHLGLSKETIINYFAFFSILLLLISLTFKWTRPVKVEEALIVIFLWILLRNLMPKDCTCCQHAPPSVTLFHNNNNQGHSPEIPKAPRAPQEYRKENQEPSIEENEPPDKHEPITTTSVEGECDWQPFNLLYSVLCVLAMASSFLMNARHYWVSLIFTVVAIMLMIVTTLIPVSCNQFNQATVNTNLLKFTLYSIVWFLARRMRLTECVLIQQYHKSIEILYSYKDHQQNHLLCGVKHKNKRRKGTTNTCHHYHDECDDIARFIVDDSHSFIPRTLFEKLDTLCHVVLKQHHPQKQEAGAPHKSEMERARRFASQLHNMKQVHAIHCEFSGKRWMGSLFSWKHRFYDYEMQNIFDLTKTLWILNICPVFLVFVFFEYFLIHYHIYWNIKELTCLIQRVKVMHHIRDG